MTMGPWEIGANPTNPGVVGVGRSDQGDPRRDADPVADGEVAAIGQLLDDEQVVGDVDVAADTRTRRAAAGSPASRERRRSGPTA